MPSQRAAIHAPGAPKPNGNYSHVVREGNTLHVAGFMGDLPASGEIIQGGIEEQTVRLTLSTRADGLRIPPGKLTNISSQKQAIENIKACLEAAGSNLDKVVRRRIYILDMKLFRQVDAIWADYFEPPYPVSTCIGVTALAKEGALVELEVVAEA